MTNQYLDPKNLLEWSFLWTEVRLVVAAAALFLGGVPPVYWLFSLIGFGGLPLLYTGMTIAWIISGLASGYLLYRWYQGGMLLFGKKEPLDLAAFLVACVSGINLGLAGLIGQNIGMSISSNYIVFVAVGVLYLASAYHLYTRRAQHDNALF